MVRIAFVIDALGLGGTEKSLVELINSLPESQYEITIFALKEDREIVSQIQRKASIVSAMPECSTSQMLIKALKTRKFYRAFQIGSAAMTIKISTFLNRVDRYAYKRAVAKLMLQCDAQFDYAVFYSLPISIGAVFTIFNLKASMYYAWVHMDLGAYPKASLIRMKKIYEKYDKMICVSEYSKQSFLRVFPEWGDRAEVFYNILDYKKIKQSSNAPCSVLLPKDKMVLFTCARLSHEKRPDWAIAIAKSLRSEGFTFVWYWAGNGEMYSEIQQRIVQQGLEENLVLLGNVSNPYPLYKQCDVYVQLSEHESYCISLAEAAALSGKIVSTDYPTAFEITAGHPNCLLIHTVEEAVAAIEELTSREEVQNQEHPAFHSNEANPMHLFPKR